MRDRWTLGVALGSSIAFNAWTTRAVASDALPGIDLQWRAPPECPDEAWARAALSGYLGHGKVETFKPMGVRVDLSAVPGGRFRAVLALDDGKGGDRRFEGPTCGRVADAAVLIVALMFDPVEVSSQIETPPAVARREPPIPSPELPQKVGDSAATGLDLGIETTGDIGSLPEPTVGAGLVAGLRIGRTHFEADAVAWVPRRALGGPTAGGGGEIGLFTAGVRGCYAVFRAIKSAIVLAPCARLEGGIATGQGFGIAEPASSTNPWAAAFLGFSIRQSTASALGGWLTIEGGTPFVRTKYVIEDFGTVFRPSPVLGRLSLGLAWSFP